MAAAVRWERQSHSDLARMSHTSLICLSLRYPTGYKPTAQGGKLNLEPRPEGSHGVFLAAARGQLPAGSEPWARFYKRA